MAPLAGSPNNTWNSATAAVRSPLAFTTSKRARAAAERSMEGSVSPGSATPSVSQPASVSVSTASETTVLCRASSPSILLLWVAPGRLPPIQRLQHYQPVDRRGYQCESGGRVGGRERGCRTATDGMLHRVVRSCGRRIRSPRTGGTSADPRCCPTLFEQFPRNDQLLDLRASAGWDT